MSSARWMRIVGIWQMVGGGVAAVTFLDAVRAVPTGRLSTAIVLCGVCVAIATAVAGYGLYRGRAAALVPSLIAQALQVIGFNIGSAVYQLTLGPYVYLTIVFGQRTALQAGFMPRLLFSLDPAGPGAAAVNVLACWCFWKLLWTEPEQLRDQKNGRGAPQTASAAAEERAPAP